MNYELRITKYSRVIRLLFDTYIIFKKIYLKISDFRNFFRFLEAMFIKLSVLDLVRKVIKSGILFH